ncbi:MAG TPA: transcriptional regulator, partial [Trinickia sp.]|nr:transcriptional regulator [Trinickia sp.]
TRAWRSPPTRAVKELRFARCCYDHLAGTLGVAVTRGMLEHGFLFEGGEREYGLTPSGVEWIRLLGLDVNGIELDEACTARQCLDWTERQYHIAGPFAARLLNAFFARDWMRRVPGKRTVVVTPLGWAALKQHLGIEREGSGGVHVLPAAANA